MIGLRCLYPQTRVVSMMIEANRKNGEWVSVVNFPKRGKIQHLHYKLKSDGGAGKCLTPASSRRNRPDHQGGAVLCEEIQ